MGCAPHIEHDHSAGAEHEMGELVGLSQARRPPRFEPSAAPAARDRPRQMPIAEGGGHRAGSAVPCGGTSRPRPRDRRRRCGAQGRRRSSRHPSRPILVDRMRSSDPSRRGGIGLLRQRPQDVDVVFRRQRHELRHVGRSRCRLTHRALLVDVGALGGHAQQPCVMTAPWFYSPSAEEETSVVICVRWAGASW